MGRFRGLWAVLMEIEDPELRQELTLLTTAIQVHFSSPPVKERSVVEFMAVRFRWAPTRTRRRLETLVDLGVLRSSRDLADHWTRVFEVVDRPAVPGSLATEMGA